MTGEICRIFIIEDDRKRTETLLSWLPKNFRPIAVKSAGRAIGLLEHERRAYTGKLGVGILAGIMLDHDLQQSIAADSDRDLSGTSVCMAILRHVSPDVPILIHSMNPHQAPSMATKLTGACFNVTRTPMAHLNQTLLEGWLSEVEENWQELIAA